MPTKSPAKRKLLRLYSDDKWATFSLQKQLMVVFAVCVGSSLLVAEVVSLALLVGMTRYTAGSAQSSLTDRLASNLADALVRNAASVLEATVSQSMQTAVGIMATASGDTFRSDYSTGYEASYYDSASYIDTPVTIPAGQRHAGETISLAHSSWVLAGSTTKPVLTTEETATQDATAHTDALARPLYDGTPEVVSLYAGFQDGFFRHYPGTGSLLSSGTAYDARQRPWYQDALMYAAPAGTTAGTQLASNAFVVTDPYLDFSGLGWCVTAATAIVHPQNQSLLGVAGVDVLLADLATSVADFAGGYSGANLGIFLNGASGTALVHSQWDFGDSVAGQNVFTYANTSSPAISKDLWTRIYQSSDFSISTSYNSYGSYIYTDATNSQNYLVVWKTAALTNGMNTTTSQPPAYVAVGTVPMATIQAPLDSLNSSSGRALWVSVVISLAVFLAIAGLVIGLGAWTARSAVEPLRDLGEQSTAISNNIGTDNLFSGVRNEDRATPSTTARMRQRVGRVDETEELRDRFYAMVRTIREGAAQAGSTGAAENTTENAFFGNARLPGWQPGEQSEEVVKLLPDAPPAYPGNAAAAAAADDGAAGPSSGVAGPSRAGRS
ncbi:hypothetical protein HK405_009082 [Cladochytrium tenue]|nr:hypothetical protein HK405_009082 [Cladochytrium tenue]